MTEFIIKGIRNAAIGFVAGVLAFFTVQLLWWSFFPYQTADIKEPMTVLNENNEVIRGEKLRIELEFTKYTNVSPVVSRNVICEDESTHFVLSERVAGAARPIGSFTARSSYGITDDTPSNIKCFFQFTNEYEVNPIRTIIKVWRSDSFTVID